ncbi:hypothetical protein ACIQ7S_03610 [Streptomyces griseoluteus]|uniref:recombination directionality factor n=1 Tax=Streptomyces griseoluteus TaxID=29306 RepID=UPI0033310FD0
MARRSIWAEDEDNKPKKRETYSDDSVGRLHSGTTELNDKGKAVPVALSEWRFSTAEPSVADTVADLFGGTPTVDEDSTNENNIDVLTTATKIPVIIPAGGVHWDMKQWINGKLKHHCDGFDILSHADEDKIGQPCGCPKLFDERKGLARDDEGPNPSITVTFQLADAPELGAFKFQTGSWTLFKIIHEAEDDVELIGKGGPVYGFLELEQVEFKITKGPKRGTLVSYTKPVITILKPHNVDVAE